MSEHYPQRRLFEYQDGPNKPLGADDKPQTLEHLHACIARQNQGMKEGMEQSELMRLMTATGIHPTALGEPLKFDYATGIPRSGAWPALRKKVLEIQPWCSVCRSLKNVQVHHMMPFHLDHSKELDPENLIPLCEGSSGWFGQMNCHFVYGHLGRSWSNYDKDVEQVTDYLRALFGSVDPVRLFPRSSV